MSSPWPGMASRKIDCPTISSAVYPNIRSADLFQLVTMPSRLVADDRVVGGLDDRRQRAGAVLAFAQRGFRRFSLGNIDYRREHHCSFIGVDRVQTDLDRELAAILLATIQIAPRAHRSRRGFLKNAARSPGCWRRKRSGTSISTGRPRSSALGYPNTCSVLAFTRAIKPSPSTITMAFGAASTTSRKRRSLVKFVHGFPPFQNFSPRQVLARGDRERYEVADTLTRILLAFVMIRLHAFRSKAILGNPSRRERYPLDELRVGLRARCRTRLHAAAAPLHQLPREAEEARVVGSGPAADQRLAAEEPRLVLVGVPSAELGEEVHLSDGRAVRIDEAVCLEQRHLRGGPGGRDVAPGTAREPEFDMSLNLAAAASPRKANKANEKGAGLAAAGRGSLFATEIVEQPGTQD